MLEPGPLNMKRISSSILCGLFTLGAGYLGHTASAQACTCSASDLSHNYAKAERVFRGKVIWSIELGQSNYYLVQPQHAYKGCLDPRNWEWVSTAGNSAACGESFAFGEDYVFFTDTNGRYAWSQTTSSCHGNLHVSDLSKQDQAFLDTRYNCCGDECGCADGSAPVNCLVDPCDVTEPCETDNVAACVSNYCGGCNAEFVDLEGGLACQPAQPCEFDRDCKKGQYCGAQSECVEVGSCSADFECNLPGNNFNTLKKCLGYGECNENRCEYRCGNAKCINHEGYDFGDCEMVIGYVRIGDHCESVSGCGSLIPGDMPAFASKQECEASCLLKSSAFPCGKSLACDKATEFCLETIPGVAPQPGFPGPKPSYECKPFELACEDKPSCAACIKPGPYGIFPCEEQPGGGILVSVPMP